MIPQVDPTIEQQAERLYWQKRLRSEQHRLYNRPMDEETRKNIWAYWQSILEPEEWHGESEENAG
jgi:hypothetical protein